MSAIKKCITCGLEKSLVDFYRHKKMKDDYLGACKECRKAAVKANYAKNKPQYQAYEKTRAMQPHRVKARDDYAKTEAGKKSIIEFKQKWLENNRVKRAAHVIFNNWKRSNKEEIPKVCSVCLLTKKVNAHHDDYSKPLSVRYLCTKCHVRWHLENGEGANSKNIPF